METLQVVELGAAGLRYVRDQLAEAHPLGLALADHVSDTNGRTYAYLPRDLPAAQAFAFGAGGLRESKAARDERDSIMVEKLVGAGRRVGDDAVVVAEERDGRVGDPGLENGPEPLLTDGDFIYYWRSIGGARPDELLRVLHLSRWFPGVAAVGAWPHDETRRREVRSAEVQAIAASATLVVVAAYDLEAEVIWEPLD